MKRIVILTSNIGTGTNLQAIIDGIKTGKINGKVVGVISDTDNTQALQRAKENNLPTFIVPKKEDLLSILKKLTPDYICLAGWKQIITDEVIDAYPNKILNTHPGLIPDSLNEVVKNPDGTNALWNKGKMTDVAMRNFLESGATYAGCSNHFLSHEFDFGKVLGRCFEKILPEDTVESLYKRLKVKENKLYVDVLAKLTCSVILSEAKDLNILVIGQNGREHALAEKYAKSKKVKKVIMTPGNGLTDYRSDKISNYPEVGMMDFDGIVEVCKKEKIDLVDVGQDDIIAAGYVDKFKELGISAFGPTQKAAQLEWDKKWAREFMVKYELPIPKFKSFNNQKKAIDYINSLPEQLLFIKASGLAFGKGVIRAENRNQAIEAVNEMNKFGKSGETFLIEEALIGEEFSLFAICDGKDFIIAKTAQDHKRINDGDRGPNTGGVGSVAPTGVLNKEQINEVAERIIRPTLLGMITEGRFYSGILYLGGMLTKTGIKIIEFNCRWGDPEAEVILPSIQTDYFEVVQAVISKNLKNTKIEFDNKVRVSIAGCSKGYPEDYSSVKGKEITGLEEVMKIPGVLVFGSGVQRKSNKFYVNGGRVFYIVGEGQNVIEARDKAYSAMSLINIEGDNLHYRKDIGWRDLERLNK